MTNKPAFRFRNPETGEYNEFEFNPYQLKRKLEQIGVSARVIRPFSPGYYPLPERGNWLNLLDWSLSQAIMALHPLSIVMSPHFEILAKKDETAGTNSERHTNL